jgi:hypothetical protein
MTDEETGFLDLTTKSLTVPYSFDIGLNSLTTS